MVKVYVMDILKLPDPMEYPECMDELPEDRKAKILRFKQSINRKQSLGAGLLLKQIFDENNQKLDDLYYGENGKPEVKGLYFNLSHSDEMVVCAVAESPVGCDIEKVDKYREGIAERNFTDNEMRYLKRFQGEERKEEFYRLWTMKESYLKMTGEGITVSLDQIEFVLEDFVQVFRNGNPCRCNVYEYDIPGYKLTVCTEGIDDFFVYTVQ